MGSTATGRVALLSLHPEYAHDILAGTKRVEFRRRPLAADVELVLIYATQPVSAIVGWFRVGETVEAAPSRLWARYREVGGITRAAFRRYFSGRAKAYGIEVKHAQQVEEFSLADFPTPVHPPQFVRYLRAEDVATVIPGVGQLA